MKSGWLFLTLSVLSYGFWGFAAKISVQRGASSAMLTILTAIGSGILALVACVPLLDFAHLNLDMAFVGPGIVTGVCVALGNLFLYQAIRTIPVSIAYPLTGLYVFVTVLLAIFFLRERMTLNHWIGVVLAVSAAYFLAK